MRIEDKTRDYLKPILDGNKYVETGMLLMIPQIGEVAITSQLKKGFNGHDCQREYFTFKKDLIWGKVTRINGKYFIKTTKGGNNLKWHT